MRPAHGLALAGLVALLPPARTATAAESYDNCTGFIDSVPTTISSQGVWCLRKDLATAVTSGAAITVATNNVTIDCNDFKIGGLSAGTATQTWGIFAQERLNIRVTNCNIRGFRNGILLLGGGGHAVVDNNINDSRVTGLQVDGDSLIQGNQIINTGGSTHPDLVGWALGIVAHGDADIVGNSVDGVAAAPDATGQATATGIRAGYNLSGTIGDNRVRNLVKTGTGSATGIQVFENDRVTLRGNYLISRGEGLGLQCLQPHAIAIGNVTVGFATSISGCAIEQHSGY